jgi:hypothetical protein
MTAPSHDSVSASMREDLLDALSAVAARFGASGPDIVEVPQLGSGTWAARLRFPPRAKIYLHQALPFPRLPPLALIDWGDGDAECLPLRWAREGTGAERLMAALREHIGVSREYRVAWGVTPDRPLTEDPELAGRTGWRKLLTGAPLPPTLQESVATRVGSPLVAAFSVSRVLLFGLGSVGSYVAEQLVRTGVGQLTIVDFDEVEAHNLCRTAFEMEDVGRSKVAALTRRLLAISPSLSLDVHDRRLEQLEPARLRALFGATDLVIAATDDPSAQGIVNACAFHADAPALYVGLYRGAKGGEVALAVPGVTPCFVCQTGGRRALPREAQPERDYGTGRLAGEMALGCDIQHVASAALRISFALLAGRREVDGSLRDFFLGAMRGAKHMVTLGMEPHFWFYDKVFGEVAGQYAFQSVWLTAQPREDCRVCGTDAVSRDDPFDRISPPIDNAALLRQFRARDD